jgi:hypothetical protein
MLGLSLEGVSSRRAAGIFSRQIHRLATAGQFEKKAEFECSPEADAGAVPFED